MLIKSPLFNLVPFLSSFGNWIIMIGRIQGTLQERRKSGSKSSLKRINEPVLAGWLSALRSPTLL